jgi:xanthine dehydrogenase accessory factor
VIGSKQKASVLRRELSEKQIDSKKIDSVFCPIGFPIGNNTPAEVAISVLAQLLKVRDEVGIFDHKTKEF